MTLARKVDRMLHDLNPDDLAIPANFPRTFTQYSWQEQRERIESANPNSSLKPLDVRVAYPDLSLSGAQIDPHYQRVCPVCRLILRRPQMRGAFGYRYAGPARAQCPRCGCKLSF